jgi:hypothetical protein
MLLTIKNGLTLSGTDKYGSSPEEYEGSPEYLR